MGARTLKIALGLSLALNLFLVCGIGGALAMRAGVAGPLAAARRPVRFAADDLPPDHRAAFRAVVRGVNRSERAQIQAGRANRLQAARLFTAPAFDAAGVKAALDRARAADIAVRTDLENGIVDFAAGLSQAERQTLAQGLKRGPLRQPRAPRQGPASSAPAG